ncbi:MAG: (Fe-S)-binding protein [Anaerolineae bacterium]|nr:MAG: (Fe-S)-binding protein [Anaerolineae bacterium]
MLTTIEKILFSILAVAALTATYFTFSWMIRTILRGGGKLSFDNAGQRIWHGLLSVVTQGGIIHHRRLTSIFHYGVAWAFIFYVLVNLVDILEGFIQDFHFLGDSSVGGVYRLIADLLSVAALLGVTYFLVRRFIAKDQSLTFRKNVILNPKALKGISRDSFIVVIFIFFHVGFRFLGQSFNLALEGTDQWQPFASLVANLWAGMSPETQEIGWHATWWLALGLILIFIPYFPYSKHAHLFMGPVNFMTQPERKALGALDPLDFEDETIEQFGAAHLTDLAQTQILDAFACIMCNRCQDACPAYVTGKELSPSALEINKRYYIRGNMKALASNGDDDLRLYENLISESAVWACTTCGACIVVCPVGNEPMFDILNIRQDQVLMESSFPQELRGAFNGMERLGNPWGMTEDRMAWAAPLDFEVPTVEENPDFDTLFWVGCAGAFDPNGQEIARATATVLQAAGINFAVLGNAESCTGDSARRSGNEFLFNEMALMNIETLNEIGADQKRIVTSCPHCFFTLRGEYPALGGNYQVLHHTQLIADLVGKGVLKLNSDTQLETVTFHDPCYLGRHNDEFEAPRASLAGAGKVLLEMNRSKSDSFCCGAGGAQMWKEEEHGQESVSVNRYNEAETTGAQLLATACPFCAIMLKDARNESGGDLQIMDIAQVIADAI